MGRATARAFPNIALVKYWGKRDEELILPAAGSLSLTLDALPTTTTVEVGAGSGQDVLILNGEPASASATARTSRFLDVVRDLAGDRRAAVVTSRNAAPTGAGMASSASGFAALALAAATAYGLDLDRPALSRLARRGSGSACRSVVPGLAIWHAGDDLGSFAEPVPGPDLRLVPVIVSRRPKAVSSRRAMRRSRDTSPFFPAWVSSTEQTLDRMRDALAAGDVQRVGELTESHALRMHAVIASCTPPVRYLSPASLEVFDAVQRLRDDGVAAWATADAGPNVCVLTTPGDAEAVAGAMRGLGLAEPGLFDQGSDKEAVRIMGPGPGVQLLPGTSGTRDE
jgi:diphosphomevalonate decarboxylase